jgi:hypothetical protein
VLIYIQVLSGKALAKLRRPAAQSHQGELAGMGLNARVYMGVLMKNMFTMMLLLLVACNPIKDVYDTEGKPAKYVECLGLATCYDLAQETCKKGYKVNEYREMRRGGYYQMTFACKK